MARVKTYTRPIRSPEQVGAPWRWGGSPQKYVLTDQQRRTLLETYDSRPETLKRLSEAWGVPRWRISRWAQEMGVQHTKRVDGHWSAEEIAYLEQQLHHLSLQDIARHLGRTCLSVRIKANRLGMYKLQEGYTASDVKLGFGCTDQKLARWLERGWLKGQRRKSWRAQNETQHDYWYFSAQALGAFIRKHPDELDPRRFDWLWVADLAFGGQFGIGELAKPEGEDEAS